MTSFLPGKAIQEVSNRSFGQKEGVMQVQSYPSLQPCTWRPAYPHLKTPHDAGDQSTSPTQASGGLLFTELKSQIQKSNFLIGHVRASVCVVGEFCVRTWIRLCTRVCVPGGELVCLCARVHVCECVCAHECFLQQRSFLVRLKYCLPNHGLTRDHLT